MMTKRRALIIGAIAFAVSVLFFNLAIFAPPSTAEGALVVNGIASLLVCVFFLIWADSLKR